MDKSVFFFLRSISIFTIRSFLFVGKFKNKSQMGLAKLEKEINPSRNLKTLAKKIHRSCLMNSYVHLDSFFSIDNSTKNLFDLNIKR